MRFRIGTVIALALFAITADPRSVESRDFGTPIVPPSASPAASPSADEGFLSTLPLIPNGVTAAASRTYVAASFSLTSTAGFVFIVFSCGSAPEAQSSFEEMKSLVLDPNGPAPLVDVQEVSFPPVGDQHFAIVGSTVANEDDSIPNLVGAVGVRDGTYLYLFLSAGIMGDLIGDLAPIAETLPDDPDAVVNTGGLISLLPELADMPPGYVLQEEDERTFAIGDTVSVLDAR